MEKIYRVCGCHYGAYARYSFNYPKLSKNEALDTIKDKKAIGCKIQIFKNDKEIKEI